MAKEFGMLTDKLRTVADSNKCKHLCNASAAELSAATGVQWMDNSFSIDITFQQPISREEITAWLAAHPNLFDLLPGPQSVVTTNAQGGGVKINVSVPQNNLRSKIVDCPTLITALCLSVDVPTQVGTVPVKLYSKAKLPAPGGGVELIDGKLAANEGEGVDAIADLGVSAFLALEAFFNAFTAELSLGCDYVITTQAMNRIGARINQIVGGASNSEGNPYPALAQYNSLDGTMYAMASEYEHGCGDCCEPGDMKHRQFNQTLASQSMQGEYNGCYPIPICLMVFPDTSVGFSLLMTDPISYEKFLNLLGNNDPDLIEGQGNDAYRTVYSTMVRHAQNAPQTLQIGTSPCFQPDQATNPAHTYIEVVVPANTDTWLPCEATGTKVSDGGVTSAVSPFGLRNSTDNTSIAADASMASFGNLVVTNRKTRTLVGEVKPRQIKMGSFRFKIDFVGVRLSAASAYMLMYNVFGCPVDGAASDVGGLPGENTAPGGVDRKLLHEAYMQYGGAIDKYLRNPFRGIKGHPLHGRSDSLAGLLSLQD